LIGLGFLSSAQHYAVSLKRELSSVHTLRPNFTSYLHPVTELSWTVRDSNVARVALMFMLVRLLKSNLFWTKGRCAHEHATRGDLEGGEFHRVSFGTVVERIDISQLHKFLQSYTLVGILEPKRGVSDLISSIEFCIVTKPYLLNKSVLNY
jgi:hypothetical protein